MSLMAPIMQQFQFGTSYRINRYRLPYFRRRQRYTGFVIVPLQMGVNAVSASSCAPLPSP